jgi:hypothetical protein
MPPAPRTPQTPPPHLPRHQLLLALALALPRRRHKDGLVARGHQLLPVVEVFKGHKEVHHHGVPLGRLVLLLAAAKGAAAAEEKVKDVAAAGAAAAAALLAGVLAQALLAEPVVDVALLLVCWSLSGLDGRWMLMGRVGERVRWWLLLLRPGPSPDPTTAAQFCTATVAPPIPPPLSPPPSPPKPNKPT